MSAKSRAAYRQHLEVQGDGPTAARIDADAKMHDALKLLHQARRILARADEIAASARAMGATEVLTNYYAAQRAKGE